MSVFVDSGIPWIGEVPNGWIIRQASQLLFPSKKTNVGMVEKNLLSLSYGRIIRKSIDSSFGLLPESFEGYNVIDENTIVLRLTDLQNDQKSLRVGIASEKGIITSAYLSLKCKSNDFPKFIYYLYHCFDIVKGFYGMGGGIRQGLTWDGIKNLRFFIPPIIEQRFISDFLDAKCAEIDSILKNTEASIEEYRRLKQSVINEAITKGIRGERPMKDSGVEWIGEIPVEWETKAIKYSFRVFSGATPNTNVPEYWDGNLPWITPADYKTEDHYVSCGKRTLTKSGLDSCSAIMIPRGSIIFSKRAPIGTVAISNDNLCTNQGCLACIPYNKANSEFFYFAFAAFKEIFELFGSGTTFKEISITSFMNFRMPAPSIDEQQEIAAYLDEKCVAIDSLIASKAKLISELEAYRKSLIYEYVTGKKEVIK